MSYTLQRFVISLLKNEENKTFDYFKAEEFIEKVFEHLDKKEKSNNLPPAWSFQMGIFLGRRYYSLYDPDSYEQIYNL